MRALVLFAALLAFSSTSSAQEEPADDLIRSFRGAEAKFAALAESLPDDVLAWRPAEGVRSTHEVLRHVVAVNYIMPTFFDVAEPETSGLGEGAQGVNAFVTGTDRDETRAAIETSFTHLVDAFNGLSEEQLVDMEVTVMGPTMNLREFGMFLATHMHEHLGQLIAYTRTNGETPPWARGSGN